MQNAQNPGIDAAVLLSRLRRANASNHSRKRADRHCSGAETMNPEPRMLEVRKNVLKQNDVIARALRDRFRAEGTLAVSLVSSPGAGKTTFLEKTLTLLKPHFRVAALVGDL